MFRSFRSWLLAVPAAAGLFGASASADVPAAKKYVDEVRQHLADSTYVYFDDVKKKLDLAELELDGVPDAEKKPVAKAIGELRQKLAQKEGMKNAKRIRDEYDRLMRDAQDGAGNLVLWPGAQHRFDEFAGRADVKAVLGEKLDDAKKRIATMAKLYTRAKSAENLQIAGQQIEQLEERWTKMQRDAKEGSTSARDDDADRARRLIKSLEKLITELPEDEPSRPKFLARMKKVEGELEQAMASGEAAELLTRLKSSWELDSREAAGWESENADVTFDHYSKETSEVTSKFGAPKTVELHTKAAQWLRNRENDAAFQKAKASPQVKAFVESVKQSHDTAYQRMLDAAERITAEAEKTPVTEQNRNAFERLLGDLRVNLNEPANAEPFKKRIQSRLDGKDKAAAGAAAEKTEWYGKAKEQAAAQWPEMRKKVAAESGFDPTKASSLKGKFFAMETDNLMGYRFKPGDFPYATTVSGHAVAAKYDPVVAGAIETIEKKLGRSLGDDDNDGRWEIVFRVEGSNGRLMARKTAEGDLTLNGNRVGKWRGEYSEPTDAAIVTIIAAKCGPLAVTATEGMVTETGEKKTVTGSVGATSSGGTSAGYGFFGSALRLLLGLAASAAALLFAGFKPLLDVPSVREKFESHRTTAGGVGLLAALCGVYWLVVGLLRGLLASASLALAGAYAVSLMLESLNFVKPEFANRYRSYGTTVGLACAVATIVNLFTQGRLWII